MPADFRSDDKQLVALVDRLDDKELICFSCYALFLYFDPMSRMEIWKQRLRGARFGNADQAEYWAGYAVSNAMSLEIRAGLGSKALGSEALAREALVRRPLVRKVLAREREMRAREILAGEELGLEPLGSEILRHREWREARRGRVFRLMQRSGLPENMYQASVVKID
jgi:hypothetical protein